TKSALESTYGVIVYQEQVMQMSKEMSGFTGGEADTLRKGIGKKIPEVLQKMGDQFIQGAIKNGVPKEVVEKIWHDILGFADYAFNKSHSACYGLIAYWTAYLKAHYPDAFMAALMTSDQGDVERLAIEIAECRHMGIEVLAPDVNESYVEFAVVPGKNQVRFGMAAIKGLGMSAAEEILRAREAGKFEGIEDFAKRVSTGKVNKRAWESLIKTGGFDAFGDRSDLLFNLETITGFASKTQKEVASGQIDIFSSLGGDSFAVQPSLGLAEAPVKHTEKERLTWERELLGLFVSAHPLDNYDTYFEEHTVPLSEITPKIENAAVVVGGLVTNVRAIVTKSGTRMAFVQLESKTGECEVVVFPNLYEQISEALIQDSIFKFAGRVSSRDKSGQSNGDTKVIADEAKLITDHELKSHKPSGIPYPVPTGPGPVTVTRSRNGQSSNGFNGTKPSAAASRLNGPPVVAAPVELKTIYVHIKDPEDHTSLEALKSTCSKHPGLSDIILVLGEEKKSAIKLPFKVDSGDELVGALVKLIGEDAVKLK
ncbi:MAG TPA: OB-fold nucleic acid binding domain-containing protein, partial [Candidatus Saccharibacteria bacterium]|nr:OB-fold nucleic acid binding domain-containing protein [Candidatus Saccharibacteria bacterium]